MIATVLGLFAQIMAQDIPPTDPPPTGGGVGGSTGGADVTKPPVIHDAFDPAKALDAERLGIEVDVKTISRFRGVRSNQIIGYGLIVGLEGTGDSRKTPFTATLLANAMKKFGTMIDPSQLDAKNVAAVAITASLPPFASPGNTIDVTVTSIGDAKSLQGGFLLQAPLYGANDDQNAIAVAQGALSIGGFNVSGSAGGSVQRNHVNVGRIPDGAIVEKSVPYQVVYNGKMYIELDEGDLTTASRIADAIRKDHPTFVPQAIDGGTIQITLPAGYDPVTAMSEIEQLKVYANLSGLVVINERTGTIVIGANVRIGPAVISHGSLRVTIEAFNDVSQPGPLSNGVTTDVRNESITATEDSQIGLVGPVNSIADLARVFQALKIGPRDMIAILQALKEQGALKARIKIL